MKLLSYEHAREKNFGVLINQKNVLDLNKLLSEYLKDSKHKDRRSNDQALSMKSFVNEYKLSSSIIEELIAWFNDLKIGSQLNEFTHSLDSVKILPPIDKPNKLICIGLNYRDHCREHDFPIPKNPIIFLKYPTSIIGDNEAVYIPNDLSEQVDYEAELAVVIGKNCKNVSIDEAKDCIAGYSIINDISARDVQFADVQWSRGKSYDTFCPFGPYLVTPDEIGDPQNLKIRCWLNDQVMQDSNTLEMIFNVYEIISFASRHSTLLPGDIIATGTPDGVGSGRKPPIYLKHGDTTKVEIENIGFLKNSFFNAV